MAKKNWRKIKNGVQANVKRIPIVGAATSKILTKVSQVDRKIAPEAGTKAGVATRRTVKIRTGIDTEKVVGKGIDKISQIKRRAAERNKPKRTVKKEEKEYLEYVADSKGKRDELSGYQIKILGGNDKDGYLIYESGNTSKISLAQLRDMIDEGKIYRYDGFILKGYGITPQEARGNYENRVNNIRSGGIQMGISGYRVVQGAGGVTVAGGCIGLSKGLCTPLVAGIGIIGVSEITLGGSDFIEGTSTVAKSILNLREREYSASKEYHRLRNGQQQLKGYSSFEGFNPLKGGLEYINAPNWVYPTANGLSFAGSIATAPIRAVFKPIATSAKAAETVTRYNNGYTQKSTSSSVYDKGYAQRLETGNYTNSSAVYDASEKVYRYAPQPSNWNIGVANSITSTGNTYSYIPQVPGLSEPLRTGIIPLTTPESYKATEQITNTVRNTFGDETIGNLNTERILNKWGTGADGTNQGIRHFYEYWDEQEGRIPSLEKRLGVPEGTFEKLPEGFKNFTEQAERVIKEAQENGNVREVNEKTYYYIDGANKAKEGVLVIVKDEKIQTIMPSSKKYFLK